MTDRVGPILFARGTDAHEARLAAIVATCDGCPPPPLTPMDRPAVAPVPIFTAAGFTVWRYDFALDPVATARYRLGDRRHAVAADLAGDTRIAFVSCNGREHDDLGRSAAERNVMWRRLADQHQAEPFRLLLHGGDQLYADEILLAHPALTAWRDGRRRTVETAAFTPEIDDALRADLMRRYLDLYAQADIAAVVARIPSLMIWDDHDIVDGWGSHPAWRLDSPIGRGVFRAARAFCCAFQHGCGPDETPPTGLDPSGASLTWQADFPGFSVLAPDLRGERRPDRVMGPAGWQAFETGLSATAPPRLFVISSVPALGPRLSLVERLVPWLPPLADYADDLRDQWQSHAHRAEWQRLLRALSDQVASGRATTVLSGEIHLATRADMTVPAGGSAATLHQLVASGIAHPVPPAAFATGLGWLARLGEDPLPDQPIRIRPLPGRRDIYTADRNFLVLTRRDDRWSAVWETERHGTTPPLPI